MVQFIHWDGIGNIEIHSNGEFIISIENNESLKELIECEIIKGVPYLKKFNQAGIPGKIKSMRKIESEEDIVVFLEYIRDKHSQYYIRIQAQERYTILKWNGDDVEPLFIIRDNSTNEQSVLIPGSYNYLVWFQADLANDIMVSHWQEFGHETTDDLDTISF